MATGFRAASIQDTDAADEAWGQARRVGDTHGWQWSSVLRESDDCIYALGSAAFRVAALFGMQGRHLVLPRGATRRLNYFQVAPELRGTGFARQAFAAFARFAIDAGAVEVVLASLSSEKVLKFYKDIGGLANDAPGWQAPRRLVAVRIPADTLDDLGERADALEDEEEV